MLRPVALIAPITLSVALVTALGIPGRAAAQSDRPATPGAARAAGPDFSAAGMTAKLVSIAKQKRGQFGEAVVLALMLHNTNTYPVLAAVVSASFAIADNKGHFIKTTVQTPIAGIVECARGQRDLTTAAGVCLDPKQTKVPEGFLEIEPDKAIVVNMDLCCTGGEALGDTVTLSGMLAVLPQAGNALNPQGEKKGRVINISLPLIPLP